MTLLPLALSLSNTFTKIGAVVAFVAIVGIAILSLLVFSQAREIKRLRDWAGRAPERAAENEQRIAAGAAARVGGAPVPQTTGQMARPVPRATPLNQRQPVPSQPGTPIPAVAAAGAAAAAAGTAA